MPALLKGSLGCWVPVSGFAYSYRQGSSFWDKPCVAERDGAGQWRQLSYQQVRRLVGAIAQGLLNLDIPIDQPVVVLSDNSVDHALLMLATMHIGRPICSVSSAYSRISKDHAKIKASSKRWGPRLCSPQMPVPMALQSQSRRRCPGGL